MHDMIQEKVKRVIVVVDSVYKKGKAVFDSVQDMELVIAPAEEEPLSAMIKEKNAFAAVLGVEKYTGPVYEAMKAGGVLARFGVGYDGIDLVMAKRKRLFVTNTPGVLESTVAEFTVFLAAEVLRKCGMADVEMKRKEWNPCLGNELGGKIWAIIGLGKIGERLARILSFGFGIGVFACKRSIGRSEYLMKEYGIDKISAEYEEVVSLADIVSLHLPANKNTHHFMNESRLMKLKPGAVLINTGRGSLVDENALYDTLLSGRLSGAGLDVFENEPYLPVNPDKDLRNLSNVVLTPHIASSTSECCNRMAVRVIRNIRYSLDDKFAQMDLIS